jgi:hypothetical protein
VRPIAEGLGGFVDQITSFGLTSSREAAVVIRVPQARFFDALERLEMLGTVIKRSVGSEEVSAEIIDLNARLRSVQRQEESFLALLERAESIADVLTVERELSRVRTQIEQLQGQLLALERSVALSTITARFSLPAQSYPEPSTAVLTVAVSNVPASVAFVQLLAAERNGIVSNTLFTSDRDQQEADLKILLFEEDFNNGLAAIEGRGDVINKTLREKAPELNSLVRPTPANSITIRFVEKGDGWVAVTSDLIKVLGYLLGFVIAIGASIAIVRALAGTKIGKAAIRAVMGGRVNCQVAPGHACSSSY